MVNPTEWHDLTNQRKYFDFIRLQLGGSMESLYTLTRATVVQTGGTWPELDVRTAHQRSTPHPNSTLDR